MENHGDVARIIAAEIPLSCPSVLGVLGASNLSDTPRYGLFKLDG